MFLKKKERPDLCIICHKDTGYTFDTPIDKREGYIEGLGQLCWKCWIEHYNADAGLKETTTVKFIGRKNKK